MNKSFTGELLTVSSEANKVSNQTFRSDLSGLNFLSLATVIAKYFYLAHFIIGLVGNSLSFAVLNRKSFKKSTIAVTLRLLTCFDLLSLAVAVIYIWAPSYSHWVFCFIVDYLFNFGNDMSNWILVVLTTQRVVAVLIPHRANVVLTMNRNYWILIGLTIFIAVVDAQDIFLTDHVMVLNCFVVYPSYMDGVKLALDWFNMAKVFFIPYVFISVGNTIMIYSIYRHQQLQRKLIGGFKNDAGQQSEDFSTSSLSKSSANWQKQSRVIEDVNGKKHGSESPRPAKTEEYYKTSQMSIGNTKQNQVGSNPTTGVNITGKLQTSKRAKQDRGVTVILIMLNLCFLVSKLPHEVQYIYFGVPPLTFTFRELGEKLLVGIVTLINNSCNFFLYVLFGSKFRRELKDLFQEMINDCRIKRI